MSDVRITPEGGYPWVLSMQRGVVVRKSAYKPCPALPGAIALALDGSPSVLQNVLEAPREYVRIGRVRKALRVHCGSMEDNPVELAEMRRVILLEDAING